MRWRLIKSMKQVDASAGSALEVDGKHVLMYTGHTNPNPEDESWVRQVQCLAVGDGVNYHKYVNNPVIKTEEMPEHSSLTDFRDPKLWVKDGVYYCVLGSKSDENSARVLLYKSVDLVHWTYVGIVGESATMNLAICGNVQIYST